MRRLLAVLLTAMTCLGAGRACMASEIVIKFSHVVAPDTPKGKAADYFKQLAEARTHGRVKVLVYPNSSLYKDKEELEALQLGAVQMLAPSLAKFGPLGLPEFEAFDLPYLFDNDQQLHKVTQGPVGQQMLKRLDARGIKGLAFWDNGFKSFSSDHPIHSPADLKGKRIRIQASMVLSNEIRALGALPQAIAFSDVLPALRAGVVEGTELDISNFYTSRAYQRQKYLTLTQHGYLGYAVIVNKVFWDGLPDDIRSELESAMRDATRYEIQIAKRDNDDALAKVRAAGLTQVSAPTASERSAFKRALLPVHERMAGHIGRDVLQAIYRETGFKAD
jgi:C4-dicarboxylate-binding protein DctP